MELKKVSDPRVSELIYAVDAVAGALDLLGQYADEFDRDKDPEKVAYMCKIFSEYLKMKSDQLFGDVDI